MGRITTLVGAVLALLVLSVCLACGSGTAASTTIPSSGGPQEIAWERIVELVQEGRVEAVSQYHSLRVDIRLADGTQYWAMEPQIDAIFGVVEQAPNRDSIVIATE